MCADGKLKEAEKQEEKQKQSAAKKLERLIEKVSEYSPVWFLSCCVWDIFLFHFVLNKVSLHRDKEKSRRPT